MSPVPYVVCRCIVCGKLERIDYDFLARMKILGLDRKKDFLCKECQRKVVEVLGKDWVEKVKKIIKI